MANNKLNGGNTAERIGERVLDNVLSQAAGIVSTKPTAKYVSGARCVLRINGRLIGFAFGISWKIHTTFTEVNTIDDYLPYELVPQRIQVEGTISALHIPGQGPSAEFMQANLLSFLFHKYIQIEVRDSTTNALLFFTDRAVIVSRHEDIRVDQLANLTLSWKAIGWKDEKEIENYPANYNKNVDKKIKTGQPIPVNDAIINPRTGLPRIGNIG